MILEFDDERDAIVSARTTEAAAESQESQASGNKEAFVAASHFEGAREGYAFKSGELGLGYYRETSLHHNPPVHEKKKRKKSVSFAATERRVDAVVTIERLCKALGNEAKRAKAIQMLSTAADAGALSPITAPLVVAAVATLTRADRLEDSLVQPMCDLIDRLFGASDVMDKVDREIVATWSLSCCTAHRLEGTDDTYEFAAGVKRLRAAVAALGSKESRRAAARRDAILHCLEIGARAASDPNKRWAKTPVESCITAAAEKRLLFSESQRSKLDRLTTRMREGKLRDFVPSKVTMPRVAEAAYHPLRNVAVGTAKRRQPLL